MAELEGFLCPLCRQDCRSVRELEAHYREEHQESAASKFKKEFVSFFENAFNISPKQSRAKGTSGPDLLRSISSPEADDYVPEPVSNVSGINPEYWDPQEMGKYVHTQLTPLATTCCCTCQVEWWCTVFSSGVSEMPI